jgi:predicted short-subunit dehydrogenase-like oxidoreductase (DUF2520 family)
MPTNSRRKSSTKKKTLGKTEKPTISIIGAGRLGTALGLALRSCGYRILAMVSKHRSRARKAAASISASTEALDLGQLGKLPVSDLILICTPDDAIHSTANSLSESIDNTNRITALHTSGALSSEILAPLKNAGLHTGSIHPLVSVSDPAVGAKGLRGAFYCVEGDPVAVKFAKSLVRDLGGHAFSIPANKKALYHAAAVMTAGHVVALLDLASEMLVASGLTPSEARKVLVPLLKSSVGNLEQSRPEKALTGTFARGDLATVAEHLKAFREANREDAMSVYRLLGKQSINIALRNGMDPSLVARVMAILEQGSE